MDIKQDIKQLIVTALELEDIEASDIKDGEGIFGSGLGLDSIDALELSIAIKKKYGVKFGSDSEENKKHFASVNALAEYISKERVL